MEILRDTVENYPYISMVTACVFWLSPTFVAQMDFHQASSTDPVFNEKDTEFPGVVARPIGNFRTSSDYHYQTLRCNVDLLKIIQLGLTFADEHGNTPPGVCCWQFNFKFNLKYVLLTSLKLESSVDDRVNLCSDDMYAQDSIDLLTKSGIDFKKHDEFGIDVEHFGELLISSGFVLLADVKWISFHR